MDIKEQLLNIDQACHFLNIRKDTIRRWVKAGKIKAIKISIRGDLRFTEQAIEDYLMSVPK